MNSLRVLFVDRDSRESEQICTVLIEASHLVLPTSSLEEACEALFVQRFDAVLLGPSLPLNGLAEFGLKLRQLQQNQRALDRIPILSLSSQSQAAGPPCPVRDSVVDGYLSEPFEPAALADAVKNLAEAVRSAGSKDDAGEAELPIFEPVEFQEQVGHDPDLMAEIIELFLSESGNQIPAMRDALACGDYRQLRGLAHTIKGSFASLHAAQARFRAQQLETAAASEDAEPCKALLRGLEADLEALKPKLIALRDGISPR